MMSWRQWLPIGMLIFLLQACTPQVSQEDGVTPSLKPSPEYAAKDRSAEKYGLIVIDPGHGGEDYGAHSVTKPYYHEKNLNLSLARMLKNILDSQGFRTCLTRKGDHFVSLDKRAEYANHAAASLFVSVHFNSAPSAEASGIEVYYYRSETHQVRSKSSLQCAQAILDEVIKVSQAKSRGTKHGDFAVIRKTHMPAVLVEAGFLTNVPEMENIKDPTYLKKLAWGISQGIKRYLEMKG